MSPAVHGTRAGALPQSRWQAMRRELGLRMAARLYADVSKRPPVLGGPRRPPASTSLVLAWCLAALVHLAWLASAVYGALLLWQPWSNVFMPFAGGMLLLLAWACRPRRPPPPDALLQRADAPTLHAIADRLAEAIGAPTLEGIAISSDYSANYRVCGWRGRRYIELGLPLLAVLTPEERVAVMAHELSHGANGDPLRGQWLFGAFESLANWSTSLRPLSIGRSADRVAVAGPFASLLAVPFELLQLALSELLLLAARGLLLLVLRDSQRAEYRADLLAAAAAGGMALGSALEKTYLGDAVQETIRVHALNDPDGPLLQKIRGTVAAITEADMTRLREASRADGWQVDATHPPTAYRVEMLQRSGAAWASFEWRDGEAAALESELARCAPAVERALTNHYLVSIYG